MCRAASFLPYTCLKVADILVLLLHNLGVVGFVLLSIWRDLSDNSSLLLVACLSP